MIMVVSRTSPDPLETMGITTYDKEYTCSAWYLYHRVGVHDTYGDPLDTWYVQRMVTWYEVPKRVQIHDLGCLK